MQKTNIDSSEYEEILKFAKINDICFKIVNTESYTGTKITEKLSVYIGVAYMNEDTPVWPKPTTFTISSDKLESNCILSPLFPLSNTPNTSNTTPLNNQTNKGDKEVEFDIQTATYDRSTYYVIYSKRLEDIDKLLKYVSADRKNIYHWDSRNGAWYKTDAHCPKVNKEDLVGLDDFFKDVLTDIKIMKEHAVFLKKLGTNSGFNYLLYGESGTGKSSFVKALATELDVAIYSAKLEAIKPEHYDKAFSPPGEGLKLVSIEDFDRTVKTDGYAERISSMLNALDGIYPGPQVLRFFSANSPEIVDSIEAMSTRMRRKLEFKNTSSEDITKYLTRIFGEGEASNIKKFVDTLTSPSNSHKRTFERRIPMRMISHYISRFIMDPSPLTAATENIQAWFNEIDSIKTSETLKKRKITDVYMS